MDSNDPCLWSVHVTAYALSELSPAKRKKLEQHYKQCFSCRELLEETQHLIAAMRRSPCPTLSQSLAVAIKHKIIHQEQPWRATLSPSRSPWHSGHWIAVALLLSLLTLGVGVGRWFSLPQPNYRSNQAAAMPQEIDEALHWLAQTQEADGHWDPQKWNGQKEYATAITGLALLSFLAWNSSTHSPSAVVERATAYLVRERKATVIGRGDVALYNRGIATLALLEAHTQFGEKALVPSLEEAIGCICATQEAAGEWGESSEEAKCSITLWQIQTLLLAHSLGWKNTRQAIQRGITWLQQRIDGFSLEAALNWQNSTTWGALALICTTTGDTTKARAKFDQSLRRIHSQSRPMIDYDEIYWQIYALQVMPKSDSQKQIIYLQKMILRNKRQGEPLSGSWEPTDRGSLAGGRIYATALATLSLQSQFPILRLKCAQARLEKR